MSYRDLSNNARRVYNALSIYARLHKHPKPQKTMDHANVTHREFVEALKELEKANILHWGTMFFRQRRGRRFQLPLKPD